jgi:hypothetical protein
MHLPNDLVSENQRQFGVGELTIDDVKIRPTKGAGLDFNPQLSWCRGREGPFFEVQRGSNLMENGCLHEFAPWQWR